MIPRVGPSMWRAITLVSRLILGVLFLVAGTGKIGDPVTFAGAIANYGIVSGEVALMIATILPWVEMLCGLGLIVGIWVRANGVLAFCMFLCFTGVVGSALLRGLDISCGCYSSDPSTARIGWMKLGENVVLTILTLPLLLPARSVGGPDTDQRA